MQLASIYLRKQDILIHASSRTTAGVWIMAEPIARLDADCLDERLGEAARAALEGSCQGVPHPASWTGFFAPVLRLAKVRSWAAFVKGARLVCLEQEAGEIKLIPAGNIGPKEGFEDRPSAIAVIPQGASAGAIGAAVRDALARAS
jgi:hypothetical protein